MVGVSLARFASLDVLDLDELHGPEEAVGNHRPRLADHRVPGVVVRQAEDETGVLDRGEHVDGFGERVGDRLVADDVEAVPQRPDRVRVMAVVRRHDRDDVGAVLAGFLFSEQRLGRRVGAAGCDAESCCRGRRSLGIRRQHAGHDLVAVVQSSSGAVHRPDEAARPTTDHGESQPSAEHLDHRIRFHRVGSPRLDVEGDATGSSRSG